MDSSSEHLGHMLSISEADGAFQLGLVNKIDFAISQDKQYVRFRLRREVSPSPSKYSHRILCGHEIRDGGDAGT